MELKMTIIVLAIASVAIFTVFYISYRYKIRLKNFRNSVQPGHIISVWDKADSGYIEASVDTVQLNDQQVLVILKGERIVRLYQLNYVYPKSIAK